MDPKTDPQPANQADIDRIWKVMEKQRTAFLVTEGTNGPHARPMNAFTRTDEGLIWFLSDRDGTKDREIAADSRVALVFTDGHSTHLCVNGTAVEVEDRAKIRDLWNTAAQAFYPNGPEDPDVYAIRVSPEAAELWDGPSAPVAIVQMAAALVTGKSAADMGRNVKTSLS